MNGWTDVPADLSDSATLARLAEYLPADAPIVSSDLARAVSTADAIAAGRSRLPHQRGLREIHFGTWEAQSFAEIDERQPDLLRQYLEAPGDIAPPGGESWNALCARVSATVDALTGDAGDIIAVAHFGSILTQVQRATGQSAAAVMGHEVKTLSVTRIRRMPDGWVLDALNHRP